MLIYMLMGCLVMAAIVTTEIERGNANYIEAWSGFKEAANDFIKINWRDFDNWVAVRSWIIGVGGCILIFAAVAFLWPIAILARIYNLIESQFKQEN